MLNAFIATLDPMLTLFICMAVGFLLKKLNVLPDNASKVLAKLETNVIFPCLSFVTMGRNCTPQTLSTHAVNIILSMIGIAIALAIAIPLSRLFIKKPGMERGVYMYALAFANSGYVGDPLVLALFGEEMLSYYKMYTFPITIAIYTWGLSRLIPKGEGKHGWVRSLLNPSIIGLVVGVIFGLSGGFNILPSFVVGTLDSIKACMGPLAMILAGFTVASYPIKEMLSDKKVYVASFLRLIILPAVIIAALYGAKTLINGAFGTEIGNLPLFLCFFAVGAPLGLNTVVFPEAYGGNPKTGAGMTLISHTLCVLTIPLMFSLLTMIFGTPTI